MILSGQVEGDEVSIGAGHTGQPDSGAKVGRLGRRRKGAPGRGPLAGEKPPILAMIQRTGEVVLHRLENVQQRTIKPILTKTVQLGRPVFSDDYNSYPRLKQGAYRPLTVHHGQRD
jgi:transposase-like protein